MSNLFLDSSKVLEIGFQRKDMLLLVGKLLFSVSDVVVLVLDFNSKTVLSLLELVVLTIKSVEFVLKVLNVLLESLSLVGEFLNLTVVVVEVGGEASVFISSLKNLFKNK